ncbi:ATP-binding protein [Mucilaginibacter corticis]|uniref:ATP-binding protein n=1 Tax=Mucilaginibacter corticis TaxID=2597670 RepID=A0A556MGR6_9SPHI|nr:ATP-binding protein [Mucilaginibacter corticis]TSJ39134.1 ATP-binding protein [Mucilaginibacter corticis]
MFRLIELNFDDQSYLGHIPADQLVFVPLEEREPTDLPYTSVLIGANGTGKSTILSYLVKIFEDIKYFKDTGKRAPRAITFSYNITYQINTDVFKFTQKNNGLDLDAYKEGTRILKWYYEFSINDKPIEEIQDRIILPGNIVAVSYLPMDRFRQKSNAVEDFYLYLGLRHRSNAASTQFFLNNTLPLLFRYISESRSVSFLKNILVFMGMDQALAPCYFPPVDILNNHS